MHWLGQLPVRGTTAEGVPQLLPAHLRLCRVCVGTSVMSKCNVLEIHQSNRRLTKLHLACTRAQANSAFARGLNGGDALRA